VSDRQVIKQFSTEPSALRRALVAATLPVALFAAVVVQLSVVNLLPLPGGDAPDLMLLLVTAVAVTSNPMTGALTGFAGGLALDVAPPVTHYAGEYALVFCLAGYLAAQAVAAISAASGGAERDPASSMTVMAVAVAAGEAGKAALGLLLAAPEVTWPAIKHVLPGAVLADLLLVPVAYWLVSRVAGLARPAQERAPAPVFAGAHRLAAVFRSASAGAVPNLRLAGSGANFAAAPPARREPKLRLAEQKSNPSFRTYRGDSTTAQLPLAGGRAATLNFARSARPHPTGPHGGEGVAPARRARKLNFATDRPTTAPRRQRGPGKGWLRTDTRGINRHRIDKHRIETHGSDGLAADRHRPAAVRRVRPSKGWLRTAQRPRANWYSNGPTTGWIRRSRAKDRWRTRRRSLSSSLVATVRDLLPSGGRR
jgi:rod shape-determining protein MreD